MTTYTHFLVTWCGDDVREDASAALEAAAGVPVSGYPVELEHLLLDASGWADWSPCRTSFIPLFLATARAVCGVGAYEYNALTDTYRYSGTSGAWIAWPRAATPPEDGARALAWLETQGWRLKTT